MPKMEREEFLDLVRPVYERGNQPNEKTLAAIGQVSLLLIMAPSGSGKDTVRRKLALPLVVGDTIRDPRLNNGAMEVDGIDYHFRGNKLAKTWRDVKEGNYVQFGMGPAEKSFYGTRAKQYPKSGPAVLDATADQLLVMRQLPFESVKGVYIVPQSFDTWQKRLDRRGKLNPAELEDRYSEARTSLSVGLAAEDLSFVINEDVRRSVHEIRRIVSGNPDQARLDEGRVVAEAMYDRLAA